MTRRLRAIDDPNTDLTEIAATLGNTKRSVERRAARECWPYSTEAVRGGTRRLYQLAKLPEAIAHSIHVLRARQHKPQSDPTPPAPTASDVEQYDPEALWIGYQRLTEKQRSVAEEKLQVIQAALTAHSEHGLPLKRALQLASRESPWSYATLRDVYYGKPGRPGLIEYPQRDWLPVIAPRHRGRAAAEQIDTDAWEHFKADYLRLEQPKAEACYRRLQVLAQSHGWSIPSDCRPLMRKIKREVHPCVMVLARKGSDALARMFPAQRRDRSHLRALEAVNADGHKFDVFAKWPDGSVARPIITAWQDILSGKILSWRVDRTESSDSYRLSFADLLREHGIPSHVYVDNGRGIAAKRLTGGTRNRYRFKVREDDPIGILTHLVGPSGIHWTTPYHGQAKPIERRFLDFCEDIAKDPRFAGAYTGNKPDAKPENYGSRAVPLKEFLQVVEAGIRESNARRGRRGIGMHGRSCDEVFNESYQRHVQHIPRATESQLTQWLLCAERVVARKANGEVQLLGARYWSEPLSALVDRPQRERQVLIYFDPDHLERAVYVHALDGRLIGKADAVSDVPFDSTRDAREHAQAKNQFRRGARMQADAARRMKPRDVAASLDALESDIPDESTPDRKVVRAVFSEPSRRAVGSDMGVDDVEDRERTEQLNRALAPHLKLMKERPI